ncbi:MAG: KH domain-containing protein, partial [Xanthomonadales bacterium]|nr:KH domain-containing protein [Xanthomonadales bacterium]
MGQKVHPIGIRLGISKPWNARWYAEQGDFSDQLIKDIKVRKYLRKELANASVKKIEIERTKKNARITIHTARPG